MADGARGVLCAIHRAIRGILTKEHFWLRSLPEGYANWQAAHVLAYLSLFGRRKRVSYVFAQRFSCLVPRHRPGGYLRP
jgi:hypothetical protein